ncbi:hypothetical protein QAD02_019529 [Eretmocerus hayati]|uniref:Uncharacterized protein n=1 Tax=Eretmocerus hayati TaxID=131215 RepID=A0ACC2PK40_9HYME|nr:hypothetical protein QAD02_019529 [Eretmocerus hayati]
MLIGLSFSCSFMVVVICSLIRHLRVEALRDGDTSMLKTNDFSFVVFLGLTTYEPGLLAFEYRPLCIGVLVTKKHVLTLNKCAESSKTLDGKVRIYAGSPDITACREYDGVIQLMYNTWAFVRGKPPVPNEYQHFVIVKLSQKVDGTSIRPVFVPKKGEKFFGSAVKAIGLYPHASAQSMTVATLKILSTSSCKEYLSKNVQSQAEDTILCTAAPAKITAKDAAGPILSDDDTLVGLSIHNLKSCLPINYHMQFDFLRNFIESAIEDEKLEEKPPAGIPIPSKRRRIDE